MNQTTEDSKKWQVIAGGNTIFEEEGTVTIPPEKSLRTDKLVNDVLDGLIAEISVKDNDKAHEDYIRKADPEFENKRRNRRTVTALKNRNQEKANSQR